MTNNGLGQGLGPAAQAVFRGAVGALLRERYDRPVMSNLIRPHYVEFMIGAALGSAWTVVSADWAGWDLEHAEGARIEVKQSAALQTWSGRPSLNSRTTRGSFDVRRRTGYWTDGGARWLAYEGRSADLFVFAWHPVVEASGADQRDPWQWLFYVVPERELPLQKTIGLAAIGRRWKPVGFDDLAAAVDEAVRALPELKARTAG